MRNKNITVSICLTAQEIARIESIRRGALPRTGSLSRSAVVRWLINHAVAVLDRGACGIRQMDLAGSLESPE